MRREASAKRGYRSVGAKRGNVILDLRGQATNGGPHVSVVMPCLNEEASVGACVTSALETLAGLGLPGEVIVVDNGSTDRSVEAARSCGARVVIEPNRGYGNAYRTGIGEARGEVVVMADADGTYDLSDMASFVEPLVRGMADMVIGSRLRGTIERGAMPGLHRFLGNPVLTGALNLLHRTRLSDAHCGMRSFRKDAYGLLVLTSPGMEFASELLIEAARNDLQIAEIPITYRKRLGGEPKLRTWRDGWRHLSLILRSSRSERLAGVALAAALPLVLALGLVMGAYAVPVGLVLPLAAVQALKWLPSSERAGELGLDPDAARRLPDHAA